MVKTGFELTTLMECQNAINFCDDKAMVHIKLQIAIVTDVVGFIRQIGRSFFEGFHPLAMNRLANGLSISASTVMCSRAIG